MVVCHLLLQADGEGPYPHLLRRLLRHTDICDPSLIRCCWCKLAIQQIVCQWQIMLAVRCVSEFASPLGPQAMLAHQAADAMTTDRQSLRMQRHLYPATSVHTTTGFKCCLDMHADRTHDWCLGDALLRFVIAGSTDAEQLTTSIHRDGLLLQLPNHSLAHFSSRAKKAEAFFKISTS